MSITSLKLPIYVCIVIIPILIMTGGNPSSLINNIAPVEHQRSYIIIDKWSEINGFLLISTDYYFLDNFNTTHHASRTDYHAYNINDTYIERWTTFEFTNTTIGTLTPIKNSINGLLYITLAFCVGMIVFTIILEFSDKTSNNERRVEGTAGSPKEGQR